jgi:intracellular septation protein
MFAAFLFGGLWLNRNFFKYVFEKTFHYTKEGWDRFTWSFAWFFVFTAFANEFVRLTFKDEQIYNLLGMEMNGVSIWIAFKIVLIMPLSAFYAWYLTRIMQRYRITEERLLAAPLPPSAPAAAKTPAAPAAGARPTQSEPEPAAAGEDHTLARAAARAAKLG